MSLFDALDDFIEEFSYFIEDGKEVAKTIAEVPEELTAAFKEFGADIKELSKDFEKEIAYDISPGLGEFIDNKQIVVEKIENLLNSPSNLSLLGKERKGQYELADHLFIRRNVYTHHGIYVGNNEVIHYSQAVDGMIWIHNVSLEEFADGNTVYYLPRSKSPLRFTAQEAVDRAWSRVGEENYNLLINNCEQFVRWCRCGKQEWNE